jgi:transposase
LVWLTDFFDFAKLTKAPIAVEIVRRIDELFAIEREINGKPPEVRREVRRKQSKPVAPRSWPMRRERLERLSPKERPRQGDPLHAERSTLA